MKMRCKDTNIFATNFQDKYTSRVRVQHLRF